MVQRFYALMYTITALNQIQSLLPTRLEPLYQYEQKLWDQVYDILDKDW